MLAHYGDKIRLVIKNYPYKYRDFSHIAAEAALAAGDQGKFFEMHDLLLEQSPKLDRESLLGYARQLDLDMDKFTAALDGKKHKDLIEEDKALALKLDLYNTPTFYINGRKVIGARTFDYLKKIIDAEMARGK